MNQCLAGITAKVHSDWIVDRSNAAPAMLGHFSVSWCRTQKRSGLRRVRAPGAAAEEGMQVETEAPHERRREHDRKLSSAGRVLPVSPLACAGSGRQRRGYR